MVCCSVHALYVAKHSCLRPAVRHWVQCAAQIHKPYLMYEYAVSLLTSPEIYAWPSAEAYVALMCCKAKDYVSFCDKSQLSAACGIWNETW